MEFLSPDISVNVHIHTSLQWFSRVLWHSHHRLGTFNSFLSRVFFSDEKEKYDPSAFRDAIIQGLNETGADLEQVLKSIF